MISGIVGAGFYLFGCGARGWLGMAGGLGFLIFLGWDTDGFGMDLMRVGNGLDFFALRPNCFCTCFFIQTMFYKLIIKAN